MFLKRVVPNLERSTVYQPFINRSQLAYLLPNEGHRLVELFLPVTLILRSFHKHKTSDLRFRIIHTTGTILTLGSRLSAV